MLIETSGAASDTEAIDPYFSSRGYLYRVQAVLLIEAIPASTLPLWWGALQTERRYTTVDYAIAQNAGAIGSLVAGIVLAALIMRVDRRMALVAILAFYASALIGIVLATSPLLVAVLWGAAFFAMTGVESIGLAYLGYSRSAQRNNGIYVAIQTLMFGVAPLVLPPIMLAIGTDATLVGFAVMLIAGAILALSLPGRLPTIPQVKPDVDVIPPRSSAWWVAASCAVTAYALFAWYTVDIYNFSEQLGTARGLDIPTIGLMLGIAGFIGIPGSMLAAYGDRRWGDVYPMVGGTILFLLSCVFLALPIGGTASFAAGLALSSFSWSLLMPYVLSLMARIDPYGRVLAASYSVKGVAGVLLSGVSTAGILHFGVTSVAWLCGACAILTLIAYLIARRGPATIVD